jgi:hypothetical protein
VEVDELNLAKRLKYGPDILDTKSVRKVGNEQAVIRDRCVLVGIRVEAGRKAETGAERREVNLERLSGALTARRAVEVAPVAVSKPRHNIGNDLRGLRGELCGSLPFVVPLRLGEHYDDGDTHDNGTRELRNQQGHPDDDRALTERALFTRLTSSSSTYPILLD